MKATPITYPPHRHRPLHPIFRHDFHRRFKALLLLGARRDMKYRGYTPEESHIPLLQSLFFVVVVIFGDSGWWKNSCWSQLWISMVSEWFPDVVTICYIFNVTPNIHACWIMLIHVDKLFVKHILFLFLRVFLCKPLRCTGASVGNIHEVSSRLMTWSYQYGRNYRSLSDSLSWGMPNVDSGVGVATKMFSKSSRKHVEQSKSKGQGCQDLTEIRKCTKIR